MRTTIITLFLIPAVISVATWGSQHMLNTSSRQLSTRLRRVEAALIVSDFEVAQQRFAEIQRLWDRTRIQWSFFTDHHEIDIIETSWARFKSNLRHKERAKALEEHPPS